MRVSKKHLFFFGKNSIKRVEVANNQKERLEILMQKYLNRACSVEERNELVEMISRTEGPEEVDQLWREVWTKTDVSNQLAEEEWENLKDFSDDRPAIPLKQIWKKVWKMSAAAAFLLCFYFVSDWWMSGNEMMIYETGYGERMEIVLDDGTEVNLNADSKLTWDKNWEKNGIRKIKLEGEAYFNVSHIDLSEVLSNKTQIKSADSFFQMPFEVLTHDLTIRVLGTAFNAAQRRGKTEVFLESGSVELSLHRKADHLEAPASDGKARGVLEKQKSVANNTKNLKMEEVVRMQPGEWVSYSSGEEILALKVVSEREEKTEWKDGILSYQDVEFKEMLQNLEDIYGKSFELDDQNLLKRRVNFSLPYKDWDTVKEMMKWMLGIEISELDDNRIEIK